MDIIQISHKYLNMLYLKSKDNFDNGYRGKLIAKLLELNKDQELNVMKYLADKGLIDTETGFGGKIKLTTSGIDAVQKLREKKIFKTIKFKSFKYLPSSRAAIEFLYYYDIIDEESKLEAKTIKVSISGDLSSDWGFEIWSRQPDKDYSDLAKILLQVGKDKIIEKLKEGTLTDNEELILLTSTHPSAPPYSIDNLIKIKDAEFKIEI